MPRPKRTEAESLAREVRTHVRNALAHFAVSDIGQAYEEAEKAQMAAHELKELFSLDTREIDTAHTQS